MRPDPKSEQGESADGSSFWSDNRWRRRLGETSAAGWISAFVLIVSAAIAARGLGPSGFGAVALAIALTGLVSRFLDVTLEEAVVHYGYKAIADRDFAGLRALIRISLRLDFVIGLIVAAALAALAVPLGDIASRDPLDPDLIRLAAVGILVSTVDGTTSAMLLVAGRPQLCSWAMAFGSVIRLIAVIVAVEVGGPAAVLIAYAIASLAASCMQGFLARRYGWLVWRSEGDPGGPEVAPVSASRLLRFSLHSSVATSIIAAQASLFQLLLGNLAGTASVGLFRVALLPVTVADTLSGPLRLVMLPEQARLSAADKLRELRRGMVVYTKVALAISLPAAVVGFVLMPQLITLLFSSEFDGAVTAARILLLGAVVQFSTAWLKSLPAAVGRPEIRTRISLALLVLSAGLLWLLADLGVEGAAIAYTAATVATASMLLYIAHRLLGDGDRGLRRRSLEADG